MKGISKMICDCLKEAGVDKELVDFMSKNKSYWLSNARTVLEKRFGSVLLQYELSSNSKACVEVLKEGTEEFKITEDGGMWIKDIEHPQEEKRETKTKKIAGYTFIDPTVFNDGTEERITSSLIKKDGKTVVSKSVVIKKYKEGEHYGRDDGEILQEIFDMQTGHSIERRESFWSLDQKETIQLPKESLDTTVIQYGEYYEYCPVGSRSYEKVDYNNEEWNFIMDGKYPEIQQEEPSEQNKGVVQRIKDSLRRYAEKGLFIDRAKRAIQKMKEEEKEK